MEELLQILQTHCQKTAHKSGLTTVQVWQLSGLPYADVRTHLKQLYLEKKIYYREGINNTLFFSVRADPRVRPTQE